MAFGLTDFVTQATDAAAAAAEWLPWNHPWRRSVDDLESLISTAQARRQNLEGQRDEAVLASVAGDKRAQKKADELDNVIVAADREIEKLTKAHTLASQRAALQATAEAEQERQAHLDDVRAKARALDRAAKDADEARVAFVASMKKLNAAWRDVVDTVGHPEIRSSYASFWMIAPQVVNKSLSAVGLNFPRSLLDASRISFVTNLPDEAYVLRLAEKAAK